MDGVEEEYRGCMDGIMPNVRKVLEDCGDTLDDRIVDDVTYSGSCCESDLCNTAPVLKIMGVLSLVMSLVAIVFVN